jgi:hypothetical protein
MSKKLLLTIAALMAMIVPANACSPAPSCWLKSSPAYVRSVCQGYKGQTVQQIKETVEEPEKVAAFVKACKKFGINFKS